MCDTGQVKRRFGWSKGRSTGSRSIAGLGEWKIVRQVQLWSSRSVTEEPTCRRRRKRMRRAGVSTETFLRCYDDVCGKGKIHPDRLSDVGALKWIQFNVLRFLPAGALSTAQPRNNSLTLFSLSLLCRIRPSRTPSADQHARQLNASRYRNCGCHRCSIRHLLAHQVTSTSPSQDDDQGVAGSYEREGKGEQLEPYHRSVGMMD